MTMVAHILLLDNSTITHSGTLTLDISPTTNVAAAKHGKK
jgi:hypothetical protein